jgi:hypothetical protein
MKAPNVLSGLRYSGLHSNDPSFKFRFENPWSWLLIFLVFLRLSVKMPLYGIRLDYDVFFSYLYKSLFANYYFLVCYSRRFQILRLRSVGDKRMNVGHWWSDAADNDALVLGENLVLSATFSTTNSAWASLDSNSSLRGERPAVDHLSRDTAINCHSGGPYVLCETTPFIALCIRYSVGQSY